MSKTLTTAKPSNEVAARGADFLVDQGQFSAGMRPGAIALPFLNLLQGLSPQVQRGDQRYIDGAQPGMIYNTVTGEVLDKVLVTVLQRSQTYCWWTPRSKGGGFQGEKPATDELDAVFNKLFAEAREHAKTATDKKIIVMGVDGLEMTKHQNFFCMLHQSDGAPPIPAMISMTKTQLKSAGQWNFNINVKSVPGALTSEMWEVSTKMVKRNDNQWYVWSAKHNARHDTALADYQVVRATVPLIAQFTATLNRAQQDLEEEAPAQEM